MSYTPLMVYSFKEVGGRTWAIIMSARGRASAVAAFARNRCSPAEVEDDGELLKLGSKHYTITVQSLVNPERS